MKENGIILDPDGGTSDDYARLITTDKEVADKFEMECWEDEFGEEEDCCEDCDCSDEA